MAMYGGGCACCGERRLVFLELDHVDGGGSADRAAGVHTADHVRRIFNAGVPDPRFRILCANCHTAISLTGACPHADHG